MKNEIMATFFMATIGAMLILSSLIFLIYCFAYEVKNRKKLYKEAKIVAVICFVIGLASIKVMTNFVRQNSLKVFSIYLFVLALFIILNSFWFKLF